MRHVHFIEFITNHNNNKQTNKKSLIPISYDELKTKNLNLIALCKEKKHFVVSFLCCNFFFSINDKL